MFYSYLPVEVAGLSRGERGHLAQGSRSEPVEEAFYRIRNRRATKLGVFPANVFLCVQHWTWLSNGSSKRSIILKPI